MKISSLAVIVVSCFIISCNNNSTGTSTINPENNLIQKKHQTPDTVKWIDSFRAFRDAVYQKDKEKVKQFIDFPIMGNNNYIWYLVYAGDEKKFDALPKTIKPFTEKDFNAYFDSLFPKRFINCILKLKTEELWKKGEIQTKELKEGNTSYIMYATFDKQENKLSLNLSARSPYKNDDGETEASEFSEIYQFEILSNGKIKFKQIDLAG